MALDNKDHYIHTESGVLASTSKEDLDHLFQTLLTDPDRERLVAHFHGGLVSQKDALDIAGRLLPNYREASSYPVFFIWESGIFEAIENNIPEIFDEKIFKRLLTRVTQFALAKIGQKVGERGGRLELPDEFEVTDRMNSARAGEAVYEDLELDLAEDAKLEPVEEAQLREVLEGDVILTMEAQAIANGLRSPDEVNADREATRGARVKASTHTLMSPSVLEEIRQQAPSPNERGLLPEFAIKRIIKGTVLVVGRVIYRLAKRRAHGVYPTVAEEILREFYLANVGKAVWDLMKNDTADAFKDDADRYGGTAFLERLKKQWQAGYHPRVVLVGHSAGAIFICNFLKHADERLPPDVQFDLILLAPGANFDLFSNTLADHGGRIGDLRIFAMQDEHEKKDQITPVIPLYPRSLLYFVSGVLEGEADKPLVGMQRYFFDEPPFNEGFPEIATVRQFLDASPNRTVWSKVDSGPGLASAAVHHGDFDDVDEPTIKSVKHIIGKGFG